MKCISYTTKLISTHFMQYYIRENKGSKVVHDKHQQLVYTPLRMKTVGNDRKTPKLFSTFTFEIRKRK